MKIDHLHAGLTESENAKWVNGRIFCYCGNPLTTMARRSSGIGGRDIWGFYPPSPYADAYGCAKCGRVVEPRHPYEVVDQIPIGPISESQDVKDGWWVLPDGAVRQVARGSTHAWDAYEAATHMGLIDPSIHRVDDAVKVVFKSGWVRVAIFSNYGIYAWKQGDLTPAQRRRVHSLLKGCPDIQYFGPSSIGHGKGFHWRSVSEARAQWMGGGMWCPYCHHGLKRAVPRRGIGNREIWVSRMVFEPWWYWYCFDCEIPFDDANWEELSSAQLEIEESGGDIMRRNAPKCPECGSRRWHTVGSIRGIGNRDAFERCDMTPCSHEKHYYACNFCDATDGEVRQCG